MDDTIIGKKYPILNDGYILLVDYMGNDSAITQAARVSYGKDEANTEEELLDKYFLEGAQKYFPNATDITVGDNSMTVWYKESEHEPESVLFEGPLGCNNAQLIINYCHKKTSEQLTKDRSLIRRLMMDQHTSPFEMVEFKFKVRIPMDCWRQWIRHRTANVNEYSTRYKEAIDSQQTTLPEEWRLQAKDNKQGSSGFLEEWPEKWEIRQGHSKPSPGSYLTEMERDLQEHSTLVYQERLRAGVAREQARKDLPLSTYTEAYWKCDLHNIFNFLRLRLDSHAQFEIRLYAQAMYEIVKQVCPIASEAFEDYVLQAKKFSRMEIEILREVLNSLKIEGVNDGEFFVPEHKPDNMTDNEWSSFLEKIS